MKGRDSDTKSLPRKQSSSKQRKFVIQLFHPAPTAITTEDTPVTRFALSTKECINKGWITSPDGSVQKSGDEVISGIQTSISDCVKIFRSHAIELDKTRPIKRDYVVWRFGDSRRICAAKFTNLIVQAEPITFHPAVVKKSVIDPGFLTETSTPIPISAHESQTTISKSPSVVPIALKTPTFVTKSRSRVKKLPGAESKHSKLLQGSWAKDLSVLRICTTSGVDCLYYPGGQLAMITVVDPNNENLSTTFVYDENGAMLATCCPGQHITCYKPNTALWFHATARSGILYDDAISDLKTWEGAPPWSNKNVLQLELNKVVSLRFKGLSNFTFVYRSQTDNLYFNLKQEDEEVVEDFLGEDKKGAKRPPINLQELAQGVVIDDHFLKRKYLLLKTIRRNISAFYKKTDAILSAFYHQDTKEGAPTATIDWTFTKFDYTSKVRETIICPLILRQQIVYQKTRLEAAAAQGIEVEPALTTKTWLQCNCSSTEIPVLSDLECQEYVEKRAPSKQMLIICIINSKLGVCDVEEMLGEIYHAQNKKHKKPCIQLPLDSFRLLKYDIATAISSTDRSVPWLIEKYEAVEGMVMMFLKSELLFCNFNFNGYGFDQHNFLKQIRHSFDLARKGKTLPSDFKFGASFIPTPSNTMVPETESDTDTA